MSALRFLTSPPPAALTGAVRELWMLEDDGAFHAGLPKPHVELVISLAGVHWWRASPGGREHRYVEGWVTPIQRGARHARAVGRRRLIGARLEPWAAVALFGPLPAGDGAPPPMLRRFIGGEAGRLRRRLIDAPDDAARFTVFVAWLEGQAALRRSAAEAMGAIPGGARVADLAREMRTTPRSLRRRFVTEAGLSPKRWLKLRRLDAVLRDPALADAGEPLAAVAQAHGFADQAHLTRDIAALAGVTPGALRRRPGGGPPHLMPSA